MVERSAIELESLKDVLEQSRSWGFLGPGPIDTHINHSMMFVPLVENANTVLDLGSGGGVPGLVLALVLPSVKFVLLDANGRRCSFLRDAVEQLTLSSRVRVAEGRAEDLARQPSLRHHFDVVVARSFGRPAVVAECAVGFLAENGCLIVSEPPDRSEVRWPAEGLAELGLAPGSSLSTPDGTIQILDSTELCSDRYPRRNGVPSKRPLF